ncbi:MAG: sensor histidine kinase, partial [Desulfococcaceae bacterium]
IEVADTGVGMSESVKSRVFKPFFTTKSQEGTGLGLSISQTLIGHNGGEISVDSAPGEGTRFTVWLPAAEQGEAPNPNDRKDDSLGPENAPSPRP